MAARALGIGEAPTAVSSFNTVPMKFANAELRRPLVLVPHGAPASLRTSDGILGRDIMSRFSVVTFNLSASVAYWEY